jgi:hypothetical protein
LAIWAILHGTTTLLLSKSIPEGHEEELRVACRATVKTLLEQPREFSQKSNRTRGGRLRP